MNILCPYTFLIISNLTMRQHESFGFSLGYRGEKRAKLNMIRNIKKSGFCSNIIKVIIELWIIKRYTYIEQFLEKPIFLSFTWIHSTYSRPRSQSKAIKIYLHGTPFYNVFLYNVPNTSTETRVLENETIACSYYKIYKWH